MTRIEIDRDRKNDRNRDIKIGLIHTDKKIDRLRDKHRARQTDREIGRKRKSQTEIKRYIKTYQVIHVNSSSKKV